MLRLGPRQLVTSRSLTRIPGFRVYHIRTISSANPADGLLGAEPHARSRRRFEPAPTETASVHSSTPGLPDEDDDYTDFVRLFRSKLKSYDLEEAKKIDRHHAELGLTWNLEVSATEWLLWWGEGFISFPDGNKRKRLWTAWRIYKAYNATKGDVAPFPAYFLERLPQDIFDHESKVAQSKTKQQALFTAHINSLLSFPGAHFPEACFESESGAEANVMQMLGSALSRDPWTLMMKHSTFSFWEMEAVAKTFGAQMDRPSRGAAALLSCLKTACKQFSIACVDWTDLKREAAKLLGAGFKTPLETCMANQLNMKVKLEFFEPGTGWRAVDPDDAASEHSWSNARCFLRHIYNAEITIKEYAKSKRSALLELHKVPIAAQISDAWAKRKQLEESQGTQSIDTAKPQAPKDVLQNAIQFKRSVATAPYDSTLPKPSALAMQKIQKMTAVKWKGAAAGLSEMQLDEKQYQALMEAANSKVLLLTGAAGCGKTFATYAIVTYLRSLGIDMHLMAPTGRAAFNLKSMTQYEASTIHSALRATPMDGDDSVFVFKGPGQKLQGTVIVDESSMVDTFLMSQVIEALGEDSQLILVGDTNQLPPVDIGTPFQDLVAWNKLPSVHLNQVHRQKAQSSILDAAHQVLQGKRLGPDSGLKHLPLSDLKNNVLESSSIAGSELSKISSDSKYINSNNGQRQLAEGLAHMLGSDAAVVRMPSCCSEHEALDSLKSLVESLKACGANPQVISPATGYKFHLRVDTVNKHLHNTMNGDVDEISKDWRLRKLGFYKGDHVVQDRNDSERGLSNGDQGVIREVYFSEDRQRRLSYNVIVDFPEASKPEASKRVEYVVNSKSDLQTHFHLKHAWSISVHKAQGGGFPIVVLFLHESMGGNLRAPMLYTAITRASCLLLILTTNDALTTKMKMTTNSAKDSTLMQRLKESATTQGLNAAGAASMTPQMLEASVRTLGNQLEETLHVPLEQLRDLRAEEMERREHENRDLEAAGSSTEMRVAKVKQHLASMAQVPTRVPDPELLNSNISFSKDLMPSIKAKAAAAAAEKGELVKATQEVMGWEGEKAPQRSDLLKYCTAEGIGHKKSSTVQALCQAICAASGAKAPGQQQQQQQQGGQQQ